MADFYSIIYSIGEYLWFAKIQIVGSVFFSLTVYSYFYRQKKIRLEIIELKKESIIFEIIKNNLIALIMSENERFTIKEMIGDMSNDFKEFKAEMRRDVKYLTKQFMDYKVSNNDRISLLEGKQRVTTSKIITYVGFFGMFVMLAISTYMTFTQG